MFRKIVDKAELIHVRSTAKAKGLTCPSCGHVVRLIPESADQVIECPACGTKASPREWIPADANTPSGNADTPPVGTKITRDSSASGTTIWRMPASGNSGGLLFFAIFWCTITGIVSTAFLSGGKISGDFPSWALIPFFAIFWVIGIGMFYAGFRAKYAKHQLTVNDSTVTLRRELFGRAKEKSLPVSRISSVSQVQFYQKNYQPVNGIEIKGTAGKIRFGSMLTDEERAWLVEDLRKTIQSPHLKISAARQAIPVIRQSYFSFVIPHSRKDQLPLAIMLTVIGGGFIAAGIFMINSGSSSSKPDMFERVFDGAVLGFRTIWIGMSSLFALGGLILLGRLLHSRGKETRLEANDSEIAIRTFKHGLTIKEQAYPRTSVSNIRTSVSGSSNGRTKKRIEMIVGGKAETLAHWVDEEKADAFAAEVRSALG